MKDEALRMALEALEQIDGIDTETECVTIDVGDVIDAIKQDLAAPVQKPVACNTGVPPLYPEMKDGETISVEYYTPAAAQQAVPDVLTRDDGENPEYTSGWNDCRQLMLEMLRGKP